MVYLKTMVYEYHEKDTTIGLPGIDYPCVILTVDLAKSLTTGE